MQVDASTMRRYGLVIGIPAIAASVLAIAFPPAFWVCAIGGGLLALTLRAQGVRTGQWGYWPGQKHDFSLNAGEVYFGLVSVTLIIVPLLIALIKALTN